MRRPYNRTMREPKLNPSPSPGDAVHATTCYMCACRCGIKVWTLDGRIRYIQGNPDHPVNRGVLCAKGSAGIMKQRSPAKLRKPLRRKLGALRGRNEFDEIEWDEALAIVEARLRAIRTTDPRKLAFFTGRESRTTTSVASSAIMKLGLLSLPPRNAIASFRRIAYIAAIAAIAAA